MTKLIHLKRRLMLCLALVALLGVFLAPHGVAQAASLPGGGVQPLVNWNSGLQ